MATTFSITQNQKTVISRKVGIMMIIWIICGILYLITGFIGSGFYAGELIYLGKPKIELHDWLAVIMSGLIWFLVFLVLAVQNNLTWKWYWIYSRELQEKQRIID